MTPYDAKLDFHPVDRWVVNGDVVQASHGPAGSTNSCMIPPPFQLTHGVKQHPWPWKSDTIQYGSRSYDDDDDEYDLPVALVVTGDCRSQAENSTVGSLDNRLVDRHYLSTQVALISVVYSKL